MFEGTDLSAAYGGYDAQPAQQQYQPQLMSNPPPAPSMEMPKSTASHTMPPEVAYAPPPAMYAQQSPKARPADYEAADSFWDRLGRKKWEVLKMIVFSLIILLALSVDHVVSHYLGNYLGASFLTATQEFLARISYPVAIILLMWIIKAAV